MSKNNLRTISALAVLVAMLLAGCMAVEAAPSKTGAAKPVVNRAGTELPADAAPLEQQVLRLADSEYTGGDWSSTVYELTGGVLYALHDSCVRPDKEFNVLPSGCESWEVSEDGLTWTFTLPEDKVWSDGTPVTAEDRVFTLQRYARADYDFGWFYSMMGITNWSEVVGGQMPLEELGVEVVDEFTFTVTTDQPAPFLIKQFADVWVIPKHIVKDHLEDGSWALEPETAVSAGPYILDTYEPGNRLLYVANDKYTGPYSPMMDRIEISFMEPDARFDAYRNGEVDIIGWGNQGDLSPMAMVEVRAAPDLSQQLLTWPNFDTFYLFFDSWNPPFDDLKVRQAFSHAIDREALINGPLSGQASAAYTMNPPGFPGESVAELKGIHNYEPELAAQLLAEAGYSDGEGFPKLIMKTRSAPLTVTDTAAEIAHMLSDNLGIEVEVQDLDWGPYSDQLYAQKGNEGGEMNFSLVGYEYDFVDGSNLLGVWGGCEPEGVARSGMPGRHTWYNAEYNALVCEANAIIGNEDMRNELYRQAERILIEDVGMIPIYHRVFNVLVNPNLAGPALEPNEAGVVTFRGFRFNSSNGTVYRTR